MIDLIMSSLSWRWLGTRARQLLWEGEHGAVVDVQELPVRRVAEVGEVDDDAGLPEGVQEGPGRGQQAALRTGAVGVAAHAVVCQAGHAHAQVVPLPNLFGIPNAVAAFKGQHQADRGVRGRIFPARDDPIQVLNRADDPDHAFPLHRLIVGDVAPDDAVALGLVVHAEPGPVVLGPDLGCRGPEDEPDVSLSELVEADRAASEGPHNRRRIVRPDRGRRNREVAVDLKGAKGEVEMAVGDQRGSVRHNKTLVSRKM